eukprot:jgi/Phyca11/19400/fgenesh1_pg.PHYCAscaffold_48_\
MLMEGDFHWHANSFFNEAKIKITSAVRLLLACDLQSGRVSGESPPVHITDAEKDPTSGDDEDEDEEENEGDDDDEDDSEAKDDDADDNKNYYGDDPEPDEADDDGRFADDPA